MLLMNRDENVVFAEPIGYAITQTSALLDCHIPAVGKGCLNYLNQTLELLSGFGHCVSWVPHNGSRISGEPLLKSFGESTEAGARPHELPYPEPEGRRIEGGGV